MITLGEFRKLPYIDHFNLYNYTVNCICSRENLRWYVFRNWLSHPEIRINGESVQEFDENSFDDYDEEYVIEMLEKLWNIDRADIDSSRHSVVIKNFDQYSNSLDEYELDKIDLENNVLWLILPKDE